MLPETVPLFRLEDTGMAQHLCWRRTHQRIIGRTLIARLPGAYPRLRQTLLVFACPDAGFP
jgi:hypothetical protein